MQGLTEEEKEFMLYLEVLEEDAIFIEGTLREVEEIKKSVKTEKELLYFSDKTIILQFIYKESIVQDNGTVLNGDEYPIFQVYDRDTKKNSYHYVADPKLERTLLLNLINRGDSVGVKKSDL